jgi:fumarylpyruvate hydrolase
MTNSWIFPPPETPSVAIEGSAARFPVRRIFCVGRNYVDHGLEMGGDPRTEPPFFFTKPADALVATGSTVAYPPATADFHYEGELVIAVGKGGSGISVADAPAHVFGHAAGNDLTRRDLQAAAKAARRPWDMSKGFDASAVVGAIRPGPLDPGAELRLTVNGTVRQGTGLASMIWSVPEIVAVLSGYVTLAPGDLIMTGTPAGVGPLVRGDVCEVVISGLAPASVTIG